ncbi:MAG: CorA family divalent cation transporter [Patescibacteria group bacterium]|nr:magnesium transporter CorA family protein [Patescibacteria group bacterium]MDE1944036.1 CorA family divalent cation transporter [Patescibacteria group bacterium]MDE1945195.1 CorA family divalent cation transporter [Patescibacteria group bacterium]MDE2057711.1 CorA family divalent cation transporter [Patescibacteria group bacterium]
MVYRQEHAGGVWVDLENPADEEIRAVAREFCLSERLEAELLSPTPFPLVSGDERAALAVFHFPAHADEHNAVHDERSAENETKTQEVDFIVGKHFIVTVRYEVIAPLHRLRKLLESEELQGGSAKIATETLLEILFAHLYAAVRDHTNHLADRLARIEADMFAGQERHAVRAIGNVNRAYLHLLAALANQEEPLDRFLAALARGDYFGAPFNERAARIRSERSQVEELVRTHLALGTELRETNSALLNAGQNQIMRTLTVVNFIFLPLGLVSWIFAMRTAGMPIVDSPNAFWIVMGIMAAISLLLTGVFAKKRWIF